MRNLVDPRTAFRHPGVRHANAAPGSSGAPIIAEADGARQGRLSALACIVQCAFRAAQKPGSAADRRRARPPGTTILVRYILMDTRSHNRVPEGRTWAF
jgi:hypothetical protein